VKIRLFVPAVPEFAALAEAAKRRPACQVSAPLPEYQLIESNEPLEFARKELGLKPAVWYGALTGGVVGHVVEFSRDTLRIAGDAQS